MTLQACEMLQHQLMRQSLLPVDVYRLHPYMHRDQQLVYDNLSGKLVHHSF